MSDHFAELGAFILKHIGTQTTFKVEQRSLYDEDSARDELVIDGFVRALGFTPMSDYGEAGDGWTELNEKNAYFVLKEALFKSLAYDTEMMPEPLASELSLHFMSLFDGGVRFFTNSDKTWRPDDGCEASSPISESTFDTGLIAIDNKLIGIVWMQDED